ncbi:hypothetical protein FO519_007898 [Halicephalobus sp. NKZ332]|nr:hypothetical protein FO519_007898 [Halicephalobus sp. NKZ332]
MQVSWGQIPGWDPNYIPVLESLVCDIYDGNPTCINVTDTIGTFVWANYMAMTVLDPCKFLPAIFKNDIEFFCFFCEFTICPQPIPSKEVCPMFGCKASKISIVRA